MRFKAWRSNADVGIHLIVREESDVFAALPDQIRQLGPWVGSREGELATLRPHYRALLQEQGFAIVYAKPSEFMPTVDMPPR